MNMTPTGTYFSYYQICHRKLWLFANGINMEHTNDTVYDGKLIHQGSYPQRSERLEEVAIEGIKVDYFDAKRRVIHEIKRSDKMENAHEWQVKYYIYVFERNGIEGCTGLLEYPTIRQTLPVVLTDEDREKIRQILSSTEAGGEPKVGLQNVAQRMKLIYGNAGSLTIDESGGNIRMKLSFPEIA